MTILEAIKVVMQRRGAPMTGREAYEEIVAANLYRFNAQDPAHVVQMTIRRHCEGIDFPSAKETKHFSVVGDGKYWPLDRPIREIKRARRARGSSKPRGDIAKKSLAATLKQLQDLKDSYIDQLRQRILVELRKLSPATFETFARQLLEIYGFEETKVTQVSGDGGIDGFGKLKVGLAHLNVAFQCKRWTKGNIQRTEIDKFRGAAQGDFEQGIFFATTSFSTGAIGASIKRGAIPIVLLDGQSIVDLMLSEGFGVQSEDFNIPVYALDLAINPDVDSLESKNA